MVVDDYHPIIRLIFQMGPHQIQHFIIGFFHFELLQTHQDTCIYRVRCGYFNAIMCFVGVDADSSCNYRSNVDFVHFVWDNFERFPNRKFTITILSSNNVPAPLNLSSALASSTKLVYVKYYRALSNGLCLDKRNCNRFMDKIQQSLQILSTCKQSVGDCICIACKRQPPSLRNIFKTIS